MRNLLYVLAIVAVAYGVFALIGEGEEPLVPESIEQRDASSFESEEERRLTDRLGRKTGTLDIRAQTIDGEYPVGLEVGYIDTSGRTRWRYAEDGNKLFTDAPLGMLVTVARAQGYPEVRQKCQVIAGVPTSCVILLRPEVEAPEPKQPGRGSSSRDAGGR